MENQEKELRVKILENSDLMKEKNSLETKIRNLSR